MDDNVLLGCAGELSQKKNVLYIKEKLGWKLIESEQAIHV